MTGDLIRARRRFGEGENDSSEQQRVAKVVDPFDLDGGAWVEHARDQNWDVDDEDHQQEPAAEPGGGGARFFVEQGADAGDEKACTGDVVNEHARGDPGGELFFEWDSGECGGVEEVLDAKHQEGERDQDAADYQERRLDSEATGLCA